MASVFLAIPTSAWLRGVEHIVFLTACGTVGFLALRAAWRGELTRAVAATVLAAPGARAALSSAFDAALTPMADTLSPASADTLTSLPEAPREPSTLLASLDAAAAADAGALAGAKNFGGIYHSVDHAGNADARALGALQRGVATAFLDTNALYPGLFAAARRAEAEAVRMAVDLLRGPPGACGLLTQGGTESVLLAVKAHRDAALARLGFHAAGSGSGAPPPVAAAAAAGVTLAVLAATSAHPALDKAGELFGVRVVRLPVEAGTLALSPRDLAAALAREPLPCCVYASAPGFAHGVVDPIPELAAVAAACSGSRPWGAEGVPLHVDNCLGGVLLSFLPDSAGVPDFDFRVPGVSSVSMDLHKFGLAPKGASVVAFRTAERRRACYFSTASFPGGLYATPTLAGSRSGAPGAVAWATLLFHGRAGYRRAAERVGALFARLRAAVVATPGLALLGEPHACILAFAPAPGEVFSPHALAARMKARGWALPTVQHPPGVHVAVTERLLDGGAEDAWVRALRACVGEARAAPRDPAFEGKGEAGIYGAAAVLPPGDVDVVLAKYLDIVTTVRALGER
jgi:glutamate/tyrosine decarboxylase-like PLP-dependent enzyme